MHQSGKAKESLCIDGGCHCGNVRYSLRWPGTASVVPVRKCACTFCRKHGGSWTSNPLAELVVTISDADAISEYRFGTATADFHVCAVCGCVPFVSSRIEDARYAVVNVNTFENIDRLSFDECAADFSGEDTSVRLERRKRNWIPRVSISRTGPS